ncbi:MAG: CoA-binding protein [Deltaproteobacteria bacterium]|nr:CoA-binding protein [Deltaproteobacteria bacterium]
MPEYKDEADLRRILTEARTIAVLGAHPREERPAHYVPAYLKQAGYRVLPVNAPKAGETLFGETVRARLDELKEPVDIVDVFRRADALPGHLEEILAMEPRPKLVWLQQGIWNGDFCARLLEAGIDVVQNRCTYAEHRRMGIPKIA